MLSVAGGFSLLPCMHPLCHTCLNAERSDTTSAATCCFNIEPGLRCDLQFARVEDAELVDVGVLLSAPQWQDQAQDQAQDQPPQGQPQGQPQLPLLDDGMVDIDALIDSPMSTDPEDPPRPSRELVAMLLQQLIIYQTTLGQRARELDLCIKGFDKLVFYILTQERTAVQRIVDYVAAVSPHVPEAIAGRLHAHADNVILAFKERIVEIKADVKQLQDQRDTLAVGKGHFVALYHAIANLLSLAKQNNSSTEEARRMLMPRVSKQLHMTFHTELAVRATFDVFFNYTPGDFIRFAQEIDVAEAIVVKRGQNRINVQPAICLSWQARDYSNIFQWESNNTVGEALTDVLLESSGGSPSGIVRFYNPVGAVVSNAGHILVADSFNNRVVEVTMHGEVVTEIKLNAFVQGVGQDPSGNIYVALCEQNVVEIYERGAGLQPVRSHRVRMPYHVVPLADGSFVVSHEKYNEVTRHNVDGSVAWTTEPNLLGSALGLAVVEEGGVVLACDDQRNKVHVLDLTTGQSIGCIGQEGLITNDNPVKPTAVAYDPVAKTVIIGENAGSISAWTLQSEFLGRWVGAITGHDKPVGRIGGLAFSIPDNTLIACDSYNSRLVLF